jgi:hypothetical protein
MITYQPIAALTAACHVWHAQAFLLPACRLVMGKDMLVAMVLNELTTLSCIRCM